MTEDRERELLAHVPTLRCMDELTSFRKAIVETDGPMPSTLYAALIQRADKLGHK